MKPLTALPGATEAEHRIGKAVLHLVQGTAERRAIEAGQADAILDPASGDAFLLPGAQRWLRDREAHLRKLAESLEPQRAAHASLDGLAAQVGVLDAAGTVLSTNQAWRDGRGRGFGAGVAEGENYLAACERADGPDRLDRMALAAAIRQVLAGERRRFCCEHADGPGAASTWCAFSITRATGEGAARVIVSREDITGRKREELLLALEYRVALGLAGAGDTGAALQAVIRALCETQGWECGRYFRIDAAGAALCCEESWGVSTPAVAQFLARSRGLVLPLNTGLKGGVARSGQPLWILSGAPAPGASSALPPQTGAEGAFIFPVVTEKEAVGVLAFSGGICREPDARLLQAARAIGHQLGRFLRQQQALADLRLSEARFRRLTELSTDWQWDQDRELRFTSLAGVGVFHARNVLGRTLWELPNVVEASADWDAHRAQLAARWSFCDFEFTAIQPDGRPGYYSISGEPVFDAAGDFTGYWGTGQDITERKRAEIALRESEADLRATRPA